MRNCQIQCNFGGTDDLCKLGKEYLTALTCKLWRIKYVLCIYVCNYAFHSRQNSETFDVLHAFLSYSCCKVI